MRQMLMGALTLTLLLAGSVQSQDPQTAEEKALRKRAEAFVETFNKGDARALTSFFTADCDVVDPEGHHIQGHKAIEDSYAKLFANARGAKLFLRITGLRVPKPDIAFEDGYSEVVMPKGPPSASRYSVVYVKKDDQWYIASVREAIAVPATNSAKLLDLAFLVGNWAQAGEGGSARASYNWDTTQNFLINSFDLTMKDVSLAGGVQWIAWDESTRQPRSWSFLSNGGFAETAWKKAGDGKWKITIAGTQRDGSKLTATNTLTKIDEDNFSIHLTDLKVDGKPISDGPVVKMKRVK